MGAQTRSVHYLEKYILFAQANMPQKDGSKEKFEQSASKALIRADILRRKITEDTDPVIVYNSNVEHQKWKYDNWKACLNRLIASVNRDRDRMLQDVIAYGHDLAIVKVERPLIEVWHRSAAYQLLKKDVDDELYKILTPKQMWLKRPEYQAFALDVFRKHIYQEVDSRKKRAIRFEKKKKSWMYPELHQDHPQLASSPSHQLASPTLGQP